MAYCTNSDVQAEFKSLTYTSGLITSAKVDEWIAQADAYINARIGLKYQTPVTDADALSILKTISVWFVAYRVKDILITSTGSPAVDQNSQPRNDYMKLAEARLQLIIDGKLPLPNTSLANSTDGVKSYSYANSIEHTFKKDVAQW